MSFDVNNVVPNVETLNNIRMQWEAILKDVSEDERKSIQDPDTLAMLDLLIFRRLPAYNGNIKLSADDVAFNHSGELDQSDAVTKLKYLNEILRDIKLPVWTPECLAKLDLSSLSFKGVCLDLMQLIEFLKDYARANKFEFNKGDLIKYFEQVAACYYPTHTLDELEKVAFDAECERLVVVRFDELRYGLDKDPFKVNYMCFDFNTVFDAEPQINYIWAREKIGEETELKSHVDSSQVYVNFAGTNVNFSPSDLFINPFRQLKELSHVIDIDDPSDILGNQIPRIANCSFKDAELGNKSWGSVICRNCDLTGSGVEIQIDPANEEAVLGARTCDLVGTVINGIKIDRTGKPADIVMAVEDELAQMRSDAIDGLLSAPTVKRRR